MDLIKNHILIVFGLCCLFSCKNAIIPKSEGKEIQVIVFSKTLGFRHSSIEKGITSIQKLGRDNGFHVDTTENSDTLISNIKNYDAVIFLSPSGDIFSNEQQDAFKTYIQNGGGFVGIHAATTAEYDWPWYGTMIGAYFDDHPKPQPATLNIVNHNHPASSFLENQWYTFDEWYNFKSLSTSIQVLITIDETSYTGGKHGENHPIAWYHNFEGGRIFYTALGHADASYSDPLFLKHILGGIAYATGTNAL
ncbi:ThuA domain-containing protein [Mariniflexile ostreae]|uniref:ThuA domain-containing protein n=1 Tax=Mariniflexile ostreae TaxID=1520892 RepID=A0ABV5FAI9_9FLAO